MKFLQLLFFFLVLAFVRAQDSAEISLEDELASESIEAEQQPVDDNAPPASLVAHKQINSDFPTLLSIDAPFTVTIDVYNIGNGSAYEVEIKDQWPMESFDLVDGEMNTTLSILEAGANYTLKFTLIPKQDGQLRSSYAVIQYKPLQMMQYPIYLLTNRPFDQNIFPADAYRKITRSQTVRCSLVHFLTIPHQSLSQLDWIIYVGGAVAAIALPLSKSLKQ